MTDAEHLSFLHSILGDLEHGGHGEWTRKRRAAIERAIELLEAAPGVPDREGFLERRLEAERDG